jgi:hypothetical protein
VVLLVADTIARLSLFLTAALVDTTETAPARLAKEARTELPELLD